MAPPDIQTLKEGFAKDHKKKLETLIEDLLGATDHVEQSAFGIQAHIDRLIHQTAKDRFEQYCESWSLQLQKFFQSLTNEITLLRNIKANEWGNRQLLGDALKLLNFLSKPLYELCDELLAHLAQSTQSSKSGIEGAETLPIIAKSLKASKCTVKKEYTALVQELREHMPLETRDRDLKEMATVDDRTRITAVTLRELVVRVAVLNTELAEAEYLFSDDDRLRNQDSFRRIAAKFGYNWRELHPMTLSESGPDGRRESPEKDVVKVGKISPPEYAWVPRVITVIRDQKVHIRWTGGTQPTCEDFFAFPRGMTNKITRLRLGTFIEAIDQCSKVFAQQVTDVYGRIKHEQNLEVELYGTFNGDKLSWNELDKETKTRCEEYFEEIKAIEVPAQHSKVSALTAGSAPRPACWAFYTETSTTAPPCLRCQWLYPGWELVQRPSNSYTKAQSLRGILKAPAAKESKTSSCCAESVAIAKIYGLQNGSISLNF